MSENPLVALQRQRKDLAKQITQMQNQLKKIDKVLADAKKLSAQVGNADLKENRGGGTSGGSIPQRDTTSPRPGEIINLAQEILADAEKPMTRGQLLTAIESRGMKIGGSNPANRLGTTLSRSETIINLPQFGFWLRSKSYAPAQHIGRSEDRDLSGGESSGAVAAVH